MDITISLKVTISASALAELVTELEDRGGSALIDQSVKKALEKFIELEAESIAMDPVSYAQQIFTNRACSCELKPIDMNYGMVLAEMQAEEEAAYQRMLDEADYYSLAYNF